MRYERILLAILIPLLFAILISGCTENTSGSNSIKTTAPAAVDLNEEGFHAFINGNYSSALELYNQSIAIDPQYTRAWINKGDVLVKLNRTSEAISSYDSALKLENNLAIVWNSRGKALMDIGNYTAANDSFDHALEIAPDFVEAKENRDLVQKMMSPNEI